MKKLDNGKAEDVAAWQVKWYRQNGRCPMQRIRRDSGGREYVIGDWSWQRNYPQLREQIEQLMDQDEANRP